MKFFVVALSLIVICNAATDTDIHRIHKFSQDCADEQELTADEFVKYKRDIEKFVDDPKAQNLIRCFLRKLAWIDQNGEFQEGAIKEEQMKQCTAMAGDNKANAFLIKFVVCYGAARNANAARTANAAATD